MTMRIAGQHAIDLRDANGVRRSTYKVRKYRGHRTAIEILLFEEPRSVTGVRGWLGQ